MANEKRKSLPIRLIIFANYNFKPQIKKKTKRKLRVKFARRFVSVDVVKIIEKFYETKRIFILKKNVLSIKSIKIVRDSSIDINYYK